MIIIPKLISIALLFQKRFSYDESHSIGHGINVLKNADKILNIEKIENPYLINQKPVIYSAALLHDICDDKYVNEDIVINDIKRELINEKILNYKETDIFNDIITNMSYSKVKKNGYPDLGIYNLTYHIIREADLLDAYSFDRSLLYNLYNIDESFDNSFENAIDIMKNRVLKHNFDNLFITKYGKKKSQILERNLLKEIDQWYKMKE
jgi:HD superfamily phosphodiesterase